ncbi:MAG TPA: hypothetical protein VMZ53_06260 [Kofleriaceae bacterium]|nr:hypothetical protein [Kofleriaceae bacterium]
MVARGAGDVGCAHCTQFGARKTCRVCKLQVCDVCAADWTTCSEPAGRELRLGMGWRVRDVDPKGRFAFVTHILKAPRIVELRQLRWFGPAPIGLNLYNSLRSAPPRLTSDGLFVHADVSLVNDSTYIDGVRWHTLGATRVAVHVKDVEGPHSSTCVSAVNDTFAYVTDSQRVVVMRHGPMTMDALPPAAAVVTHPGVVRHDPSLLFRFVSETYEPLPRKVISAIDLDGERDLLASVTWRELAIHRTVGGKLERVAHLDTGIHANLTFVALTGRWLAYGTHSCIELRPMKHDGSIGEVVQRHSGRIGAAALSRDGAYLAVAIDSKLVVEDLERFSTAEFTEHSDGINYVRFASDDHMLISGDQDNRIVVRPRTAAGYAVPVIDVELAGEP